MGLALCSHALKESVSEMRPKTENQKSQEPKRKPQSEYGEHIVEVP